LELKAELSEKQYELAQARGEVEELAASERKLKHLYETTKVFLWHFHFILSYSLILAFLFLYSLLTPSHPLLSLAMYLHIFSIFL